MFWKTYIYKQIAFFPVSLQRIEKGQVFNHFVNLPMRT